MPRIALAGVPGSTAAAVRALVGAGSVVECALDAVPAGIDVVVCEPGADGALPGGPGPALLVVVEKGRRLPATCERAFDVLEKPFDILDLRRKLRGLLDATVAEPAAARPAPASPDWFSAALVGPAAAATLEAAARLGGAVWIVGEAGTGTDKVAAALALAWDPLREPLVWAEPDALASALARLGDAERVLWVPSLDERPLREQKAFERFLALEPERRVVVTSADAPDEAVAAGTLLRSLHHALSRVSLRLAPLRERRRDIPALAGAVASRVADAVYDGRRVALSDAALRALASWPWAGNLAELEAVITRSLIAGAGVPELDAGHLRFAPDHLPGLAEDAQADPELRAAAGPGGEALPRRATVVAFDAAARAGRSLDATFDTATQAPGIAKLAPQAEASVADAAGGVTSAAGVDVEGGVEGGVEGILAAFAHDIRNPMSTIKTFAGLQAARAGDDDAELARLAVDACERVDGHLALLQRYAELKGEAPSRVDAVDVLGQAADALEAADGEAPLAIAARRSLWTTADAGLLRLVADALAAESRSRRHDDGDTAVADLSADGLCLELRIPTGAQAVDRLGKWVEGTSLPWRLALAVQAARRLGGGLDVDVEDGQLRLRWRLPAVDGEPARQAVGGQGKGSNDDQAGSSDRRRRSRGS